MKTCITFGLNLVDPHAPQYGGWSGPLAGCVNDASTDLLIAGQRGFSVSKSFVNTYAGTMSGPGYTIPPYRLVMNATADEFRRQHLRYSQEARPGDLFVVGYSGHGARRKYILESRESLCFTERFMDDTEVRELMALWPEGVRVAYLFDCCHAGGVFRTAPGAFIGRPKTRGGVVTDLARSEHRGPGAIKADILVMTAARIDQYALDGEFNGAWSGSRLACILENPNLTWFGLHEAVRAFMGKHFPSQEPGIEIIGNSDVWRVPYFM